MSVQIHARRLWPALLLGLFATGCDRGGSQAVEHAAPRVTVAHPIVRSLVDDDEYKGWLRPVDEVAVRSRVRGHIEKIHFQDGDMVTKGELLFELDPRPFEAAIAQSLAQAKVSDAQRAAAERDYKRCQELILTKSVSPAQLEKAEADTLSYAAQVAAVMQQVEEHKLDLQYSRITAPIAGRISRAMLTQGNLVDAGGTDPVLTTIVAVDPIYVYFNIDERSLQRYQKMEQHGQPGEPAGSLRELKIPFRFRLDTDQGFPHTGVLDFADNKVSTSTGTIEVRGVVSNRQRLFVAGSSVRVRVPVSERYEAVVVPDSAVLADQDRRYLLVLGKDNVVVRRDITPGRLLDDGMRVLLPAAGEEAAAAGVKDWIKTWQGAWIVTIGLQRARINYPIEPRDAAGGPIDAAAHQKN